MYTALSCGSSMYTCFNVIRGNQTQGAQLPVSEDEGYAELWMLLAARTLSFAYLRIAA